MTLEASDEQAPRTAHFADPGNLDLTIPRRLNMLERLGMPDGEAHIAVLDPIAEQLERGRVGEADDASIDDQGRLVDRVDQGAHG